MGDEANSNIDIEEVYHEIGGLGRWQWINMMWLWLPIAVSGYALITFSFTGLRPGHFRCAHECELGNATFNKFGSDDLFRKNYFGETDYCSYHPMIEGKECTIGSIDRSSYQTCDPRNQRIIYDMERFDRDSSIVTEFDLVCKDNFKIALVGTIYMLGIFVGSAVMGRLSDISGRKTGIQIGLAIVAVAHLAGGLSTSYEMFCVLRFITAIGAMMILPAFTMTVELVGSQHRTLAGMLCQIPFAIGEAFAGIFAIFVQDWRTYRYVTSVPIFLIFGLSFLFPESPRWLLATGKMDRFWKTIEAIGEKNKTTLSEDMMNCIQVAESTESKDTTNKKQVGLGQAFRHPMMRINLLIMCLNFAVVTLGYYGLSMIAVETGSNVYVSSILAALIEVPSYLFCLFTMDRLGRKPICVITFFLTGITCIPAGYLPNGAFQTCLVLLGKFADTAAFALVFLYVSEMFPTQIRSSVLGICSMTARIGGMAAPQVVLYLPFVTTKETPMVLMGVCAIFSAIITLRLPETLGSHTLQTVEDVEILPDVTKPFFVYWSNKKLKDHLDSAESSRHDHETNNMV